MFSRTGVLILVGCVVTGIRGKRIGMDKTIVRTVTDLFTVYDVTEDGYCVNERGRTYDEIESDIIRHAHGTQISNYT